MKKENENLDQLLRDIFGPERALEIGEDIRKGDDILNRYPAPQVRQALVTDIKAAVAEELRREKTVVLRHRLYYKMAVAAVLLFAAVLGLRTVTRHDSEHKIALLPSSVWESDYDSDTAMFSAELKMVEEKFAYMQSNGGYNDSYSAVADMAEELMEIENEFWKG
jgi:hypothetical protein